jgi:hypothetical protein
MQLKLTSRANDNYYRDLQKKEQYRECLLLIFKPFSRIKQFPPVVCKTVEKA